MAQDLNDVVDDATETEALAADPAPKTEVAAPEASRAAQAAGKADGVSQGDEDVEGDLRKAVEDWKRGFAG